MSGLIKAGAAATLARRLETGAERVAPPPRSARDVMLDEAHAEIAALRTALAERDDAAARAVRAARREGEQAALEASAAERDMRFATIGTAARDARVRWDETVSGLDTLAVSIARTALSRIVGDCDDLAALVTRQIASRIAALRRESIVALRVSSIDFPDDAALAGLARDAGTGAVAVIADPALGAGDCRIDLRLGHVDLGVRAQWGALDALLDRFVAEEVA